MYHPFEDYFLGYSPQDVTVDFYQRINSLADRNKVYLDYGAGRAAWFDEAENIAMRNLRHMQGKFAEVIATDVDPVVLENVTADRCVLIEDGRTPLPDGSVDVLVADYVIEHVPSPDAFAEEVSRLLKPGGWFCARTPHKYHYVAVASRIMGAKLGDAVLRKAQPFRRDEDVFDKVYRMNTLRDISATFPTFADHSYVRRCDPTYYFGSRIAYEVFDFAHRLLPTVFSGNLIIFLQKPDS